MLTFSRLVKYLSIRLFFLSISGLSLEPIDADSPYFQTGEHYCPLVETLSFGSDITVKCNDSYLIFSEINTKSVHWKFANPSTSCVRKGKQHAAVNRCNVTRIGSKYLTVPLRSSNYEVACVYCQINYKPITPLIIVAQADMYDRMLYTFNVTAPGLAPNQSFEILWAKRVEQQIEYSFVYWFLPRCIAPRIKIMYDTPHSIVFTAEDAPIGRVEFIIRYCDGPCRDYEQCDEDDFTDEISNFHLQIPSSIEKVVCDEDCLNGIVRSTTTVAPTTTPTTTITTTVVSSTTSTTTMTTIVMNRTSMKPSTNLSSTTRRSIAFRVLCVLIVLVMIILIVCIVYRLKDARERHVYTKTNRQAPNEGTSSME